MFCNNCGAQIPDNANFCQKCGNKVRTLENEQSLEVVVEEGQEKVDNNICLLESKKVNCSFGQGELYAYKNRLEYINKKGIKTECYFEDIKDITTFGKVFTLTTRTGKSYSFGIIDGDANEWIRFIKYRIELVRPQINQNYREIVNELINNFRSNRIEVIKAFSNQTGIDLVESKKIVDEVYNERIKVDISINPLSQKIIQKQEEKLKVEQLKKDKIPYCPKCHSTSLSANKKGFGFVKGALGLGLTGFVDVGMIAGGANANKIILTCLNCGHKFKPRKKIITVIKERKMNFVIKCKNCGKVKKFNEERTKDKIIICSCGSSLGYEEEEIIDNLAERLSRLKDFELVSATKERNQEILDEELSELYSLYCEESDEDSRKMFFAIINRLYLICNRKNSEDKQKLYNAITEIFDNKESQDIF